MSIEKLRKRLEAGLPIPVGLAIHTTPKTSITVEEMRVAVESCPEHPVAKSYALALSKLPKDVSPDKKFFVDTPDIEALVSKMEVKRESEVEMIGNDPKYVVRKSVSDKPFKPEQKEKPKPAPSMPTDLTPSELEAPRQPAKKNRG